MKEVFIFDKTQRVLSKRHQLFVQISSSKYTVSYYNNLSETNDVICCRSLPIIKWKLDKMDWHANYDYNRYIASVYTVHFCHSLITLHISKINVVYDGSNGLVIMVTSMKFLSIEYRDRWPVTIYNHFTALCIFSWTTRVNECQKVKTNLDFLEQETASSNGISWVICKSATCLRQITMAPSHHSVITGWMPLLPPNQQHPSTEGKLLPYNQPLGLIQPPTPLGWEIGTSQGKVEVLVAGIVTEVTVGMASSHWPHVTVYGISTCDFHGLRKRDKHPTYTMVMSILHP